MRTSLAVFAAGVATATGIAVAGPALAAVGADAPAAAVTSRVDRITSALSGLVKDGTLTQAQADKVVTTLDQSDALRGGPHGGRPGGPGRDLSTAATALGMTEADLRTALQGGKTLAQVAGDKGVAVPTLVTALVDAEKARIAQAVKDGGLTQAQADQRLADVKARVTERVNATRPERPGGRGHGHGPDGSDQTPATPTPATPSPSATS